MDLITDYRLGDDIAIILLVLGVLSLAGIVAGFIVPQRMARNENADGVDPALGRRLGALLGSAGSVILWVGVPAVALLFLVPGSTDDRILRSGMLLAGLLLAPLAAWRGMMILVAALGVDAAERGRATQRLGALAVVSALSWAVLPIVVVIWFLQTASGIALLAMAAGAALSALALRATAAPLDAVGAAAVLLVGVDENDEDADDTSILGAPLELSARLFRRGAALGADLVALVTALAGAAVLLGVQVIAAEAVLVPLLALGVAWLTAAIVAVVPHVGAEGREAATFTLGGVVSSMLGAAALVACAVLWLPSQYKALRFAQAGQANFTDPAIAGEKPLPRAELTGQIEEAAKDMGQWISATDDSRDAGAFLDVITLHTINPSAVIGGALGLGALAAFGAVMLMATIAERRGGTVLRAARTSRTGGALGGAAALGSSALLAAGGLSLVALIVVVLSVLSAGVPELASTLLAHAGLGALVVLAGHAAALMAPSIADRPGTPRELREVVAQASPGPRGVMLLTAVIAATAVIAPIVTTIQLAPRAGTVWEDRSLHALTPMAMPVIAGVLTGAVTVLLVGASLLDAVRRAGALAVVESRSARLEGRDSADLRDVFDGLRRASVTPVVVAVLLPVAAGFGFGASSLPGLVLGAAATAGGLGLWMLLGSAATEGAVASIASGRYGGPGSWAHSGAITSAVLVGALRSSVAAVALPLLLVVAFGAALITPAATAIVWGGDVDPALRWGIAVVALIVASVFWVITATAPEVDLEDGQEDLSQPLFGGRDEPLPEQTLDAMTWDAQDDDVEEVLLPVEDAPRRKGRGGRSRRRGAKSSAAAQDPKDDAEDDSHTED